MATETVKAEIVGRIGVLTFNRPKSLNAINSALIAETTAAVAAFEKDERVLCIVVHGEGRCFSAGFDMKESAAREIAGMEEWRAVLTTDFDFIMQFWTSTKPTIAAAHGYCLAGGFELLMACDLAVASEETLMGEPEVRFGSGIVAMLAPWVTGPKQAKELLLTGNDRVSAQRCYEMGILNRVTSVGAHLSTAMELAEQVSAASSNSVQMTKLAINRQFECANMRKALSDALEIEIGIESDESPERLEFNRIRKELGLKAALDWRDSRFR